MVRNETVYAQPQVQKRDVELKKPVVHAMATTKVEDDVTALLESNEITNFILMKS